jgi:hypothetical protein
MQGCRILLVAVGTLSACAGRQELQGLPGPDEARGLLTTGFETTLFRPCVASAAGPGDNIGLAAEVAAVVGDPWPPGTEARDQFGQTYYVYYVRALIRPRAEPPPVPAGHIRISSAPKFDIARLTELRAARPGECGWDPERHMQRAP